MNMTCTCIHVYTLYTSNCTCMCRFAEDDMNENILFDEQEEGKFKSSNEALIKACTIYKLIERLTYHEYAGTLNTYSSSDIYFCSCTVYICAMCIHMYVYVHCMYIVYGVFTCRFIYCYTLQISVHIHVCSMCVQFSR